MKPLSKLSINQINKRINNLRMLSQHAEIRTGWITYMRQAMSMTLANLGKLTGLTTASVQQIEKRERAGKVTIQTMRKIAEAMECDFVYAFVPKDDLNEFLKKKAIQKATRIVREADVHMTLEDQRVSENMNERIERIADDLLEKGDIW